MCGLQDFASALEGDDNYTPTNSVDAIAVSVGLLDTKQ